MRILGLFLSAFLLAALPAHAGEPAAPAALAGPRVLIRTIIGDITLELDPVHAPVTTANFLRYVKEGHFDGTVVYRVAPGFVIQMGSWDAEVQARSVHDPIALEANNGLSNVRGAVAMARAGDPASATAEFFVNLADNPALDHQAADAGNTTGYAVFAHVVAGMEIVDKIAGAPLGDKGPMPGAAPVDPITITKLSLLPDAPP